MAQTHTTAAGDTMVTVAFTYGFRDWRAIYDHPQNAPLKESRPNPDVLNPGDSIYIPDKEPIERDCATNQRHQFTLKSLRALFCVRLNDPFGVPYGNVKYQLVVEGETIEGQLENGEVKCDVLPTTHDAELTIWPDAADPDRSLHWTLRLGHLDTTATNAGIKGRLNNLGYACDPSSDALDDDAKNAIRAFQTDAGLPATGEIDDATKQRLEAMHVS